MKLSKLHRRLESNLSSKEDEEDEEKERQDNFNLDQLVDPGGIMPDQGPDKDLGDVKKMSNLPPFN